MELRGIDSAIKSIDTQLAERSYEDTARKSAWAEAESMKGMNAEAKRTYINTRIEVFRKQLERQRDQYLTHRNAAIEKQRKMTLLGTIKDPKKRDELLQEILNTPETPPVKPTPMMKSGGDKVIHVTPQEMAEVLAQAPEPPQTQISPEP